LTAALKRYAGREDLRACRKSSGKPRGPPSEASVSDDTAQRGGATGRTKPLAVQIKDMGAGERLQGTKPKDTRCSSAASCSRSSGSRRNSRSPARSDLAAFVAALQKMLGGGAGLNQGYEESEEYRKLRGTGYPLRQVLYFVGEKSTLEVTSVATQEFPRRTSPSRKALRRSATSSCSSERASSARRATGAPHPVRRSSPDTFRCRSRSHPPRRRTSPCSRRGSCGTAELTAAGI